MLNIKNVINGKTKTMKLSEYFEYRKCEYCYLKLIPIKSNRNVKTEQISQLINTMYRKTNKLIYQAQKKIIIEQQMKASFYIHITNKSVQFYFIIPKVFLNQFKVKFKEVWQHIEIQKVDNIPTDLNKCTKYDLHYKYNDSLSLAVDKRTNELLNSNITIVSLLEENEEVGIFYNFIPTSEKQSNYFRAKTYKKGISDFKAGKNLKKSKNLKDFSIITVKFLVELINDLLNSILNPSQDNQLVFVPLKKETSDSTKDKAQSDICQTQIIISAKSSEKEREKQLCTTLANTFDCISQDNALIKKEITKTIDIKRTIIKNVKVNKTSVDESNNFLNMPSMEVIKQFKMIEHNKVLELKAPTCLEGGEIRIGTVKNKENKQEIFYSMDKEFKRLSRVLLGSMGAGKDYYMVNMAKDIIKANRGLIVIDYIDKCQLAENIKRITPKDRLIEIDCSNVNSLQAFLYNEISYKKDDAIYKKIEVSMQKAQQFELLLDSINDVNSQLTPRMLRYLYSAGTVTFYKNKNASFKNVIDILKDPVKRNNLINSLDKEEKETLIEEVEDLLELNKYEKNDVISNYDSKIDGILDRIAKLKSSSLYAKLAFTKDGGNNINFIEAMNERKVILIKIPHSSFKTKMLKDLMCTFYLSKIWLAKQEADTDIQTEVFINELHQSLHSQLLLEDILVEHRKYNITFTFAMHYLDQLTRKAKASILASGSSFLLISGCDKKAYEELKVYFEKDGYTETDLAELERFNALCLVKNEETNYSSFVAKLPS